MRRTASGTQVEERGMNEGSLMRSSAVSRKKLSSTGPVRCFRSVPCRAASRMVLSSTSVKLITRCTE